MGGVEKESMKDVFSSYPYNNLLHATQTYTPSTPTHIHPNSVTFAAATSSTVGFLIPFLPPVRAIRSTRR